MDRNTFHAAAERARLSFAASRWNSLTASEQSDAIYRELRLLDAEAARRRQTMREPRAASRLRLPGSPPPNPH